MGDRRSTEHTHGIFAALDEGAALRQRAFIPIGQWITGIGALIALVIDGLRWFSPASVCLVGMVWFTALRVMPPRPQAVLHLATPALAVTVPCLLLLARTASSGAEAAFTNWGPGQAFVLVLALSMLRLEVWRPAVLGTLSAAAYFATYGVATWDLPRGALVGPALSLEVQVLRCGLLILGGVALSVVTRNVRRSLAEAESTARARDLFGKYRLGREIASGGMGTVVEATYLPEGGFARAVAVKRIHPHLAQDPAIVESFRREAALSARLAHPNIVSVLDFGRVEDTYFLAMEHVTGVDLRRLLKAVRARRQKMPALLVAYIGREVLEGLSFAHERAQDADGTLLRVVHRDLTPGNVLVARTGQVKVSDFGIARALRDSDLHRTVHLAGSLAYLAPEQVEERGFDARVDLFALAVVLWESLSLKHLFAREGPAATMRAIVEERAPPITQYRPDVDPAWDAFFARALAKTPEARFASAREMGGALEALAAAAGGMPHAAALAQYFLDVVEGELLEGAVVEEVARSGADDPDRTQEVRPRRPVLDTEPVAPKDHALEAASGPFVHEG